MKRLLTLALFLLAAATLILAEGSTEKSGARYPTQPIQVIVPAGAGGDTDLNCRILGAYLEKEIGQPIIVVNVGGAGGSLGSRKVMDAPTDGYTALFFHPSMLLNQLLGLVDYGPADMANAGMAVLDETNVFVTHKNTPYKNMKDVVAAARKSPETITFATEIGGFTNLQVLAFQDAAGVKLNVVDVGGAAAKTAALKGEQVDIIGTQYGLVKDYVANGDFRVLGVLSDNRNPAFPDVPTFKEQGIDISFTKFFFFSFPPKASSDIVTTFTKALERAVANPAYQKEVIAKLLVTPHYMAPAEALSYIKKEEDKYNKYKDQILAGQKK